MKLFCEESTQRLRSSLSRPIVPAPCPPRPETVGRRVVSSRRFAIGSGRSASAGTTALGWLWRLMVGCGLGLAMVLGSELLPAATPNDSSETGARQGDSAASTGPAAASLDEKSTAGGEDYSAPGKGLRLSGKLFVDPNRLSRVHSRFAGQVVELGRFDPADGESRPLRHGDAVRRDQLLAVVWSREVGEKKSDLIHAMSRLMLDQIQYDRLSTLEKGIVPVHTILDARRKCESDLIAVQRVQRTLRSWRLSEREIGEVAAEAKAVHEEGHATEPLTAEHWAKFEIRSPLDGIILERNVTIGDLVGVGADMFKIGDLTTLGVMANLYEEDLPLVESLPSDQRRWTIYVASRVEPTGIAGRFETIGNVIDPRQHTASLIGWVANESGALRAGQLIHVEIAPAGPTDVASSCPAKSVQSAMPIVQKASSLSQHAREFVPPSGQFPDVSAGAP
ncbi:MAG TPA: efflux RND transporter periplasmic adaptor subunit [Pirellulales bacterium]|nr:efflux RND transporter periplasmic adaptor subunit [Pirellulales bacterium]